MKKNDGNILKCCMLIVCLLPCVGVAAEWVAVDCPAPPPPAALADRFVLGGTLAGGEVSAGWSPVCLAINAQATVAIVPDVGPDHHAALQVDWRFIGRTDLEYIELKAPALSFDRSDRVMALHLRCEDADLLPQVRFIDATGEHFQYDVAWERGPGWRTGYVDLAGKSSHWGGDGVIQLPLILESVLFDRPAPVVGHPAAFAGNGRLWLGDLAAVRPPAELRIEEPGKRFGHLFSAGETLHLRATTPTGTVSWQLFDGHGASLASGGGDAAQAEVAAVLPKRIGHYTCRFTVAAPGFAPASRDYLCAILDDAPPPAQTYAGFSVHWLTSWPVEGIDLLPRYAVSHLRDEITWSAVEPKPGTYAIPAHARQVLDRYAAIGIKPLLVLDYANKNYGGWTYPNSEPARAGFAAYAGWMAKTLGSEALAFEVWNEWVGGCGMGNKAGDHSPAAYGPLCAAAYAAIKAADPTVQVVAIGGEYGDRMVNNIGGMIDAGATGDAFSIHPYCWYGKPEVGHVGEVVPRVRAALHKRGKPEQVWATEMGWPTHVGVHGTSLADQARFTTRSLALLWSTGAAQVYWYDFQDDGLDPTNPEHNFGLLLNAKREWAPKPAALAFAAFNRRTAGATAPRLVHRGDTWLACATLPDGRDLVVAWALKDGVAWQPAAPAEQAWDIFDAPLDQIPAVLGPEAIYLVGKGIVPPAR